MTNNATRPPHERLSSIARLHSYCIERNWSGFDPYDALNSRLFALTPFSKSRHVRILLTQVLKLLPLNLRPLLGISREQNPKGLALFLMAFLKLSRGGQLADDRLVTTMIDRLITLRSLDTDYWCWGYSFPWQTRTVLVPRGAANLVCTSFVAEALLDAYESTADGRCLEMAVSAADYIRRTLYWEEARAAGFSYPTPALQSRVHNASFLAAALLVRTAKLGGDPQLLEPALKAARYAASRQRADGSWSYGESATQGWVDNFHTGFNLCALRAIGRHTGSREFEPFVRAGFDFYRKHFIKDDGVAGYFHDRLYPVDAHCVAQTIITLVQLRDLAPDNVDLANTVFQWAMDHLWDDGGYFYYRYSPVGTNRLSYMRWSQAWMLLALSWLEEASARGAF